MSLLFPELEDGSSPATTVAPSQPTPATTQASHQPQQQAQGGHGGGSGGSQHGATLLEKADDKTIERLNKLFALPGPFGFTVAEAELVRGTKLQLVLRGDGLEDLTCALTRSPDAKPFLTTTHFGITYHGETPDKRHLAFLKRVAFLLKEVPLVALQRLFKAAATPMSSASFDIEDSFIFSFASRIAWRNFFEGHELYRGSCERFNGRVVNIQHTDIECSYAGPRHDNGTVSFFNYLRQPVRLADEEARSGNQGLNLVTDLDDHDIIKGGTTRLDEVLDQVAKLPWKPDAVMVSSACISLITGDDVDGSVDRLQKKVRMPVIHVGSVTSPGVELLRRARLQEGDGFFSVARRPRSVNLIGLPRVPGDDELIRLLAAAGIEVNTRLIPEIDVEAFRRFMAAELTVFYGWEWNSGHYTEMTEGLSMPSVRPPSPFGMAGTERWLAEIVEPLGMTAGFARVLEHTAPLRERFAELSREAARYQLGFIVSESEVEKWLEPKRMMGLQLRALLAEMGFSVEYLLWRDPAKRPRAQAAATGAAAPDGVVPQGASSVRYFSTPAELEQAMRESRSSAFYSELFFDRRITRTGHAVFSMNDFAMGIAGAVDTLERLLARCRTSFFRRYAKYLGPAFGSQTTSLVESARKAREATASPEVVTP